MPKIPEPRYQVISESPKGRRILGWFRPASWGHSKTYAEWLVSYVEKRCDDSADNLGLQIVKVKP